MLVRYQSDLTVTLSNRETAEGLCDALDFLDSLENMNVDQLDDALDQDAIEELSDPSAIERTEGEIEHTADVSHLAKEPAVNGEALPTPLEPEQLIHPLGTPLRYVELLIGVLS